jgi:ferredoxin-like protein FixX
MNIDRMQTPELLSLDKFNVDEEESHIVLDKEICAR